MPKAIDLKGQRFHKLLVLHKDIEKSMKTKKSYWVCQCDCGNIKSIYANNLKTGHTQSCGCYQRQQTSKSNIKDLTGKRFGKLTVISQAENGGAFNSVRWLCKCDCGSVTTVYASALLSNLTKSCGCLRSIGEENICKLLTQNNIKYIREYSLKDLKYYRFDFYLPEYNRLIEYDGEQHDKEPSGAWKTSLKIIQKRDQLKTNYALKNNIDLVRIPYWERDNITLDLILGNTYLQKRT